MNDRSDENLVAASRTGDRNAYGALVRIHYKHVFLVCLGTLGNDHDAEDIAQDAMIKAFEQIHRLKNADQFGRWVAKIAKNLCFNLLRRRRCAGKIVERRTAQPTQDVTENDDLQQAIEKLPKEFRLPLVMYYFDGQSVKTVAERLDMSTSGVYTKLRTATRQLHEILVNQGETE